MSAEAFQRISVCIAVFDRQGCRQMRTDFLIYQSNVVNLKENKVIENVMLSERSQTQTDTNCLMPRA